MNGAANNVLYMALGQGPRREFWHPFILDCHTGMGSQHSLRENVVMKRKYLLTLKNW